MIWFLFFVAIVVSASIFVWDFRRKAVAREAASKKRFEEMFMARQPAGTAPAAPATEVAASVAPVHAVIPAAKPPVPAAAPVQRFLGPAETLVYRLLRASIPDHEVFANVTLASVIGQSGAGYDREQQLRRLAQHRLDFVVCDKSMRVLAVVEVESAGGVQVGGDQSFKADSLKAAGIVQVRLNPKALPRREDLRAMVCGGNPAGAAAAGVQPKSG